MTPAKTAKKKLDFLDREDRLLPIIYKVIFLICFVAVILIGNYLFKERVDEYRNSVKISVIGTFKSSASGRGRTLCFFKVEGNTIPISCNYNQYYMGEKVRLNKVIKPLGENYYEIAKLP